MNAKRRREFACTLLIDTEGRYLFQKRDNIPGILQPGKIGLFGGHREGTETFLQCVVREIHEETSLAVPPERFEFIANYEGADVDNGRGDARGTLFIARGIPFDRVVVTEGSLLAIAPDDLFKFEPQMTPFTQHALGLWTPPH